MTNRFVMKLFTTLMPIFTWLISFLIPGRKAAVAATEARNKGRIMTLVQNLESYMDPEGKIPLQTIVEKCYAKGSLETAIYSIYPILKKHQRLDEVFHYQSLPALAAHLERQGAAQQA